MYLGYLANKNDVIRNIWNQSRKAITVENVNAKKSRSIQLFSTVNAKYFDKEFELIGSKTGQWGNSRSLLCVFLYKESIIIGVISKVETDEDRFIAMKQLMQTAKQHTTSGEVISNCAIAAKVSEQAGNMQVLYEKMQMN